MTEGGRRTRRGARVRSVEWGGGGSDAHVWRAMTPTTPSTVHRPFALTTTRPSSSASELAYAAASASSRISQDHVVGASGCVYVFYSSFSPGGTFAINGNVHVAALRVHLLVANWPIMKRCPGNLGL